MEGITGRLASAGQYQEETQTRKGPWTTQEDMELIRYISLHGEGRWSFLAKAAGLKRTGKSCRLRWVNYLRPDLKRSRISHEEEHLIIELQGRWGNRWSCIARSLPGRTDNEIKNYWRTRIKKKMAVQTESASSGIDADNRLGFEPSTVSYCLRASSQRTYDLDNTADSSTSFPRKTTSDEITVQTDTPPYLQDDNSSQAIPLSERNYGYEMQGKIYGPLQINDDGQPISTALREHLEESHNHWLSYNFSMGSSATLLSSELFADDATQDVITPSSSSYMVASPEAFYHDDTYLNCYSDVLWNMDKEDDRFSRSPDSGLEMTHDHIKEQ